MLKPLTVAFVALALTGCGATRGLTAASVKSNLGATALATTGGALSITAATESDGPSASHLLPETESFSISGKDSNGSFTLLINAVNPGGELYVPKPARVTMNDKAVPVTAYGDLGVRLQSAKLSDPAARNAVYRAGSILQLSR